MHLSVDERSIIWPGRLQSKPEGFMIPTHLKVLTIKEKPFVYTRQLNNDQESCALDEIPCPYFNSSQDGNQRETFKHFTHLYRSRTREFLLQRFLYGFTQRTVEEDQLHVQFSVIPGRSIRKLHHQKQFK